MIRKIQFIFIPLTQVALLQLQRVYGGKVCQRMGPQLNILNVLFCSKKSKEMVHDEHTRGVHAAHKGYTHLSIMRILIEQSGPTLGAKRNDVHHGKPHARGRCIRI